jgi:hypothetical protein
MLKQYAHIRVQARRTAIASLEEAEMAESKDFEREPYIRQIQ